jgi:hypothetical protein
MKVVRFTHNHVPCNGGELAGFAEEQADELIASGHAVEAEAGAVDEVVVAPGPQFEEIAVEPRRKRRNG